MWKHFEETNNKSTEHMQLDSVFTYVWGERTMYVASNCNPWQPTYSTNNPKTGILQSAQVPLHADYSNKSVHQKQVDRHSTKKPVTTMLTYPWKYTVLHCNHLGNTWKPLVLMTRHFDYRGSNSWPLDHDSTFHVTETSTLTTWPSVTSPDKQQ